MKFGLQRTINLNNIDPIFGASESETIVITDAFSFEEARQKMTALEAETIGYYKGVAVGKRQSSMPLSSPAIPVSDPDNVPVSGVPAKQGSVTPSAAGGPPAEFNID